MRAMGLCFVMMMAVNQAEAAKPRSAADQHAYDVGRTRTPRTRSTKGPTREFPFLVRGLSIDRSTLDNGAHKGVHAPGMGYITSNNAMVVFNHEKNELGHKRTLADVYTPIDKRTGFRKWVGTVEATKRGKKVTLTVKGDAKYYQNRTGKNTYHTVQEIGMSVGAIDAPPEQYSRNAVMTLKSAIEGLVKKAGE